MQQLNRIAMVTLFMSVFVLCGWGLASEKPVVVSTDPANGATDVPRDLKWITVTFSKPMYIYSSGVTSQNWTGGGDNYTWSADAKVFSFSRKDPDTLLPPGTQVSIWLNLGELRVFRDAEGNYLDTYYLYFTTTSADIQKFDADPAKGFNWPYYLYFQEQVSNPGVLIVEPNNTLWHDDLSVHEQRARENIKTSIQNLADPLHSPLLMPVFPRYSDLYTHALDRATLLTTKPGLERIDLQLLAMVDDARQRLADRGMNVEEKVWLRGFSASGMFVGRFSMLHPQRIKAVSAGAGGYGPIVPVANWEGESLPYPIGISDLKSLTGTGFDVAAFRQVPFLAYVGDEDTNTTPWFNANADADVPILRKVFGGPDCYQRYPRYEAAFRSVDSHCEFVIYPGIDHRPKWDAEVEFFEYNRTTPAPPPREKPLLYKIFFPHVVCYAPWTTEIALINTTNGAAIKGELRAFRAGGDEMESISITIPSGGRVEVIADDTFDDPDDVAYVIFQSDSGFVNGYTRFYEPNNRVAIPAATGSLKGWFTKKEAGGWTGITLLNTEEESASVRLTAYDNNGVEVAAEEMALEPGVKRVGLIEEFFQEDVAQANYFSYSSDRLLSAYSINISPDQKMMDGMASGSEYMRKYHPITF